MTDQQALEGSALRTEFNSADLRIERMLYLPCVGGTAYGPAFLEFVDDYLADEVENNGLSFPGIKGLSKEELEEGGDLNAEYIADRQSEAGYLAEVARPVYKYWPDGSLTYSWGNYYTRWFYGDSVEDIMKQAVTWAEVLSAEEKAKAK